MTRSRRRSPPPTVAPPAPTVPDLVRAPELAAIFLLEHALELARDALVAEHPTLSDDLHRLRDQGTVFRLALAICCREAALREMLRRYRRAVRDACTPAAPEPSDDDAF